MDLKNLSLAQVGDVLYFNYRGDGKPARDRLVKVNSIGWTYINGQDLEIDEPRNFSFDKAEQVKRVATAKQETLSWDEVVDSIFKDKSFANLFDGASLANLYKSVKDSEVEDVTYFSPAKLFVITPTEKAEASVEVSADDTGYVISFINKNGETLNLSDNVNYGLEIALNGNSVPLKDFGDFLSRLNKHFDYVVK